MIEYERKPRYCAALKVIFEAIAAMRRLTGSDRMPLYERVCERPLEETTCQTYRNMTCQKA